MTSSSATGPRRAPAPAAEPLAARLRPAALLLALSALSASAIVAIYVLFWGTDRGIVFDVAGLTRLDAQQDPVRHRQVNELLATISVESLLLVGGAAVGLALLRRRPVLALAAFAVLGGANVTTQVLKPALGALDLVRGEAVKELPGSFPSGHATVAMSIGLTAVLVAPHALKLVTAIGAAGYAAVIGVALLALGWHYPSDVAAGYLVALAWAAAAGAAVIALDGRRTRREPDRWAWRMNWTLALALAAITGLAFTLLVLAAVLANPAFADAVRLHTIAAFSAVVLGVMSVVVVGALLVALRRAATTAAAPSA